MRLVPFRVRKHLLTASEALYSFEQQTITNFLSLGWKDLVRKKERGVQYCEPWTEILRVSAGREIGV